MEVLDKREIFTDIPGRTSIIEHRMYLVDDPQIRCMPFALPYALQKSGKKSR